MKMANTTVFAVAEIHRMIRRARRAGELRQDEFEPQGWSVCSIDPRQLLAIFDSLRLKEGFALRAYQFKEGGNGNAFVYAMPADRPLPEPRECPTDDSRFLAPPIPMGSLDDFMEAIEGDGTLWSYLSASLMSREMSEIGAMWHGAGWSTHRLLGRNPLSRVSERRTKRNGGIDDLPDLERGPWEWVGEEPKVWRPAVTMGDDSVEVKFHTYSGHCRESIYRHVDSYRIGVYCFSSERTVIAGGPGGYIF